MSGISLYEIERGIQELLDMREEAEENGALPDELAAIDKALAEYFSREVKKVDATAQAITLYKQASTTVRLEADRLRGRADRLEATADRIRAHALAAMQAHGVTKLETPMHVLRIQENGGVEPLEITHPVIMPETFKRVSVSMPSSLWREIVSKLGNMADAFAGTVTVSDSVPDSKIIREALKHGQDVPGAKLRPRGVHLRVQ